MMTTDKIIQSIEDYMSGNGELYRYPIQQQVNACIYNGHHMELHTKMEPYYEMYLNNSERLDGNMRYVIADIARLDPQFGEWASRQDLMKMARAWAGRGYADELLTLMDCMIAGEYEPLMGEGCYKEVMDELQYQRVDGNSSSAEIFALLHAFMSVVLSTHRYDHHKELFLLLKEHWDLMRHLYSIMMGRIIGLGFVNFVGLANNLKTAKYHPYLHIVYWMLLEKADDLVSKKQQKGMTKALKSLEEIMDRTNPNRELDELCEILFPEQVKELLANHPKTPYRQLEKENSKLKMENDELKAKAQELSQKLSSLVKKQENITHQMASELKKAFVEDSIPFSVLEEELLELPRSSVGGVFTTLNDMLGGNEVWQRHFKELRSKVRKREQETDTPLQPTVQGDYVVNKNVDNEVGYVAAGGTGICGTN